MSEARQQGKNAIKTVYVCTPAAADASSFLPSLLARNSTIVHVNLQCIMSRTTRLNKALTAALYSECDTMTIETQVINEKENDNISNTSMYIMNMLVDVAFMHGKSHWVCAQCCICCVSEVH